MPLKESEAAQLFLFATPWTVAHQAPLSTGILQARILEWVAISFSRGSSGPRDQTQVSHIAGRLFTIWTTRGTVHLKIVKMVYWGVILLLYYIYKTQN